MACLNTATVILSSGGQMVKLGDVLDTAALLEQWVTR
jgi:hypothetical protein